MKRIFLFALLAGICGSVAAQPRIRTERPDGKSVAFYLDDKSRPGTLTVFLRLKELSNCNTSTGTAKYEVLHSGTQLLLLRPVDASRSVGYSYSYRSFPGPVDRTVDTAFVYRMPTSVRWPTRVSRGESVYDRFRRQKEGAQGLHFEMEKGDTVFAMRRGTVVEVKIAQRDDDAPAVSFTTASTNVLLEQPDGSMAWYICLDPDGLLVEPGDEVLPGTPLGLAGSYDGEKYKISVQTYWWTTVPESDGSKDDFVLKRFFPRFATDAGIVCIEKGVYRPVETEELVTCEMTKKEIKRWRAKGKPVRHAGSDPM